MQEVTQKGDIAFWVAAVFLFGIFASNVKWSILLFLVGGFIFCIAIVLVLEGSKLWKSGAMIFFALVAGAAYYHGYIEWKATHTDLPFKKGSSFFAMVTKEPKPAGNFMMLAVDLSRPYAGELDIFVSPLQQFNYGDLLWIKGSVDISKDVDNSDPVIFLPQIRLVAHNEGSWFKRSALSLKTIVIQRFDAIFPTDPAALLAGIMLGETANMSTALKDQMAASGTSYIVGMYGYKIAIITFAMSAALKDVLSRKALLLMTLVVVALFIMMAGGSISAIRAGIMGCMALVAHSAGRVFSARNALTFTAVGMAIFDPLVLTDATFQLSFLSFLGIFYLGPALRNIFGWTDGGILKWKEHAMLSLSTNLAILPIVMNTFGSFSITSFISNILIMIPWVLVLFFGMAIALFGTFSLYVTFFISKILDVLLRYELFIIYAFATFIIPVPSLFASIPAITLYYGILFFIAYYYGAAPQKD
jgi:ComEC/Rec2-related protein